jgi:dihydropteroate synthase
MRNFAADMQYTLNIKGRLMELTEPQVMGILNVTPDSFYAASRAETKEAIAERARQIAGEGGTIIDIGACSTRPGSQPASQQEETERLRMALRVVRLTVPDAVVSVDTFRPDVARMAVEEFGVDIINDVSEGSTEMFRMVARLGIPYVLMSVQPDLRQTLLAFSQKVQQLRDLGQKDIILDPGFGFGKTLEQNYALLNELDKLQVMELPVLVGVSRKSMIYRLLGISQAEALNGTTILNTIALTKGASILRVHDVKEAVECCRLTTQTSLSASSSDNRN